MKIFEIVIGHDQKASDQPKPLQVRERSAFRYLLNAFRSVAKAATIYLAPSGIKLKRTRFGGVGLKRNTRFRAETRKKSNVQGTELRSHVAQSLEGCPPSSRRYVITARRLLALKAELSPYKRPKSNKSCCGKLVLGDYEANARDIVPRVKKRPRSAR
jgi:hypothetical protein